MFRIICEKKLITTANKMVNFAPSIICKKTDSPKRSDPKGGINDGGKGAFPSNSLLSL